MATDVRHGSVQFEKRRGAKYHLCQLRYKVNLSQWRDTIFPRLNTTSWLDQRIYRIIKRERIFSVVESTKT